MKISWIIIEPITVCICRQTDKRSKWEVNEWRANNKIHPVAFLKFELHYVTSSVRYKPKTTSLPLLLLQSRLPFICLQNCRQLIRWLVRSQWAFVWSSQWNPKTGVYSESLDDWVCSTTWNWKRNPRTRRRRRLRLPLLFCYFKTTDSRFESLKVIVPLFMTQLLASAVNCR